LVAVQLSKLKEMTCRKQWYCKLFLLTRRQSCDYCFRCCILAGVVQVQLLLSSCKWKPSWSQM